MSSFEMKPDGWILCSLVPESTEFCRSGGIPGLRPPSGDPLLAKPVLCMERAYAR